MLIHNGFRQDTDPVKLTFEAWMHEMPPTDDSGDYNVMACSNDIIMLAKASFYILAFSPINIKHSEIFPMALIGAYFRRLPCPKKQDFILVSRRP